jgi:hypothetical protein
MTPLPDQTTPPHIELLGAPALRPFDHELKEVRARWLADVERHNDERTVFADHRLSIEKSAARD